MTPLVTVGENLAADVSKSPTGPSYLSAPSIELDMVEILAPVMHQSDLYGWAGWIHWETSGAHFYAWDDPKVFSVDIYTCKAFSAEAAVRFTEKWFAATEIVHKEF